ncbi:MAG TPA: HAD family hydrolase [Symbiobacteriaceae bacterium]|jgi:hypothetical protein
MKRKLLALDLDGTLLDRAGRLPDDNRQAVVRARAAGLDVVLVTGRSWRGTQEYYAALELTGPAICYLGALVVADGSGRILTHRPLVPEAWALLRALALAEGLSVTACLGADQAVAAGELPAQDLIAFDTAYANCVAPDFTDWAGWNTYTELAADLAPCQVAPTMAAIYGDRAVRRVLELYPDGLPASQYDLTDRIAGETVLHVWHGSVDKGRALSDFCQARGYRPEDVVSVGDAYMDLGMIAFAGLGVAVPDGDPRLQAAADLVATPPDVVDRILKE